MKEHAIDLRGLVRPGDHIIWSGGGAEPQSLSRSLVAQRQDLSPISVFIGTVFSETLCPDNLSGISVSGLGGLGTARALTKAGLLQIIPCHFGQISRFIAAGLIGCDVAFVQVSAPGPDGQHSFGATLDYMPSAVRRARTVVAEINDQVPWTYGAETLAPSRIDYSVNVSRPLIQVPATTGDVVSAQIGRNAAAFIGDGAVLQVGIGRLADAVLQNLADRRRLGVHSGMIGDSMLDLIECGAVDNADKSIDRGLTVTGALFGTQRLYNFAHLNRDVYMQPVSYTHDPFVLAQHESFTSINSALEIDLAGAVNAEAVGERYIGAVGGQPDFVRAGQRSSRGCSLIVLPSTAGGASTLRARLTGPATTCKSDVDIVVTEYGAAELRGQSLVERARRLVAIAHPDFQEGLESQASDLIRRGF